MADPLIQANAGPAMRIVLRNDEPPHHAHLGVQAPRVALTCDEACRLHLAVGEAV